MLDYSRTPSPQTEPAAQNPPVARGGLALADILGLAARHTSLVLTTALACALVGALATKTLTPRYLATAQIYIDPRTLPVLDKETAQNSDSNGFINLVESQTHIVASQIVLEKVVTREKLESDAEFGGGSSLLAALLGTADADREARSASALRTLASRVAVRRPERTFVIEVSVSAADGAKAARLANAVAQSYIASQGLLQSELAQQTESSLGGRLNALRDRLRADEARLEDYKARNGFVGTRTETVNEQQLKETNQQLTLARVRADEARARYDQVQQARRSGGDLSQIVEMLNVPSLVNLRAQQAEAAQKLADVSAELGPLHPTVHGAEARVAELRRQTERELSRIADALLKEQERSKGSVDAISRKLDELQQTAIVSGQASVKLRDLERDVEASRSLYESFLNRSRQAGELQQIEASNTHIITMATPPLARRFPPPVSLTAPASGLFGLGLGLALAVWRERKASGESWGKAWDEAPVLARAPATDSKTARRREPPPRAAAPVDRTPRLRVSARTRFIQREPGRGDRIDLTRLGLPVVRANADRMELRAVFDALGATGRARGLLVLVTGASDGLERAALALNLALESAYRGQRSGLVLIDELATAQDQSARWMKTTSGPLFARAQGIDLPTLFAEPVTDGLDIVFCAAAIDAPDMDFCFNAVDRALLVATTNPPSVETAPNGVRRIDLVVCFDQPLRADATMSSAAA